MMKKRIIMSFFGVILSGICVGIFKLAAFGVDPFQAFMSGLNTAIPISFGTLYMIANIVLLLFSLIFNRKNIGIATFINLFLLGYITQFTYAFLQSIFSNPNLIIRTLSLIIGVVLLCFASALYMTADLGVSTYDSIAITMADKWHIGPFKWIRVSTDVCCVIIGAILFLAGGGVMKDIPTFAGIGTIFTAFFMGPLIDFFNVKCARPLLYGKDVSNI